MIFNDFLNSFKMYNTSIKRHLDYTSARLRRLGFGVVAFFRPIYRLKDRKKRWFSRWSACEIPPFSFFVRFSFNGCRLTIAVCRYKMQASQISCAGAYRQYGTKQDCRIAPYFIGRNRRIVERKPSSLNIVNLFYFYRFSLLLCISQ